MVLTAWEIARLVQGELLGREDLPLIGVAPPDLAGPDQLAILISRRYLGAWSRCRAGAALLSAEFRDLPGGPETRILVRDGPQALRRVLQAFAPPAQPHWGIHPSARIGRGARWEGRIAVGPHALIGAEVRAGADCVIEAGAVLGPGVSLGDRCHIGAYAVIHAGTRLGDRAVVHAGARLGGPGFGFVPGEQGLERLPHRGGCLIGDDVEIGANTTIDQGSVGPTVVGAGTKIDNLVQIAHHVRIGRDCIILAQAGLAGSTVLEDQVTLGGQAGLAGHLTVHRGARVAAQSGVIGDVPPGATVSGYPARNHREVLRQAAALRRLAPLVDRLEAMARTATHA